jgi:hypothetical protein
MRHILYALLTPCFLAMLLVSCQKPEPEFKISNDWTCVDTTNLAKYSLLSYESVEKDIPNLIDFDTSRFASHDSFFEKNTDLKLLGYLGKYDNFQFLLVCGYRYEYFFCIYLLKISRNNIIDEHLILSYQGAEGGQSEQYTSFIRNDSIFFSGISFDCCQSITDSSVIVSVDSTDRIYHINSLGAIGKLFQKDTTFLREILNPKDTINHQHLPDALGLKLHFQKPNQQLSQGRTRGPILLRKMPWFAG